MEGHRDDRRIPIRVLLVDDHWVVREGYLFAADLLTDLMAQTKAAARSIESPELAAYLEMRETDFAEERDRAAAGFEKAKTLWASLSVGDNNRSEESS